MKLDKIAEAYLSMFESKKESWNGDPDIGWWDNDDSHITLFHGTHEKHIDSVLKSGLNRMDPDTGMLSVTADPNTAHGYASMSGSGGESNFRKAGANVKHTPDNERVVFKINMPKDWLKQNMDENLSGNLSTEKKRLQSKELYDKHKADGKSDQEYYALSEFRLKKPIPPEFISGYMKKKEK